MFKDVKSHTVQTRAEKELAAKIDALSCAIEELANALDPNALAEKQAQKSGLFASRTVRD